MSKRVCTLLLALVLILSLGSTALASVSYTEIHGTSTDFKTYLVVKNDANIPAAEYTYTIAAGTPVAANLSAGTLAVLAGPTPANVVIGNAGKTSFTVNQATTAGTATDGIVNSTEKKYATNTVTVNFANVQFDEPGVYRYVITQAGDSTKAYLQDDSVATRTLDVYIKDNNGTLEVEGYVMYSGTVTTGPKADGTTSETKTSKYVNTVLTQDYSLTKQVSGNQASKDKYFKFTVTIANAGNGTIINVDMSAAQKTPTKSSATIYEAAAMSTANNITSLAAGTDGSITHDFYLSHGDTIRLTGVPKSAVVTVVEVPEDYTCDKQSNTSATTIVSDDVAVTFTNTRAGTVPTGVILSVVPGILVVAFASAGLILFSRKKRSEA